MDKIEFGNFIREQRKNKKMTIRQLSLYSGVSNAYISQMENGERNIPSPEILQKISKPLGVEYGVLMEKAGYLENIRDNMPHEFKNIYSGNLTELINVLSKHYIVDSTNDNDKKELKKFGYPEDVDMNDFYEILSFEDKIKIFNQVTNNGKELRIKKENGEDFTVEYGPKKKDPDTESVINLSNDSFPKNIDIFYEGMELTEEERAEFWAIARGIFSARRALKEKK